MRISDEVAKYLLELLEESHGDIQIQRNELANNIGCVPSQINYVITSRFTPEHGYIVESRRGGGGYIRITRIKTEKSTAIMNIINSIGSKLDALSAEMIIKSLVQRGIISENTSKLMLSAVSDRVYTDIPVNLRCILRASILKNMLLTQM
ncbi:transcriptional regulator CtsR [Clostridium sp. CAG:557]|nr:transcriptional regulator CtsR [Clostridium sp. CAG:557]